MSHNDDKLISQLVTETYTDGDEADQSLVDLKSYFEKRLNEVNYHSLKDYIIQHNLLFGDLIWQEKTQCYRLTYNGSVLDFPSNWSIFKSIKSEELIYLESSIDQDCILDIFSELTGDYFNLAIAREKENVKLVFLSEETSKNHIKWMRGYFEVKNLVVEKVAA